MMTLSLRTSPLWLALLVLISQCTDSDESPNDQGRDASSADATSPRADGREPLPANAPFDYQIGGDYAPPGEVEVVARDWFTGDSLSDGYSICYVNAFQTEAEDDGVDRPDERSALAEPAGAVRAR